MKYLVESNIKKFVHDSGKQITADGLHSLEVKLIEHLSKCCRQFNGHKKRIDASLINMIKF